MERKFFVGVRFMRREKGKSEEHEKFVRVPTKMLSPQYRDKIRE